mmetsp:Transcript_32026/g.78569  ORF Transcript_32026/g.78569 Transcript_32026/m.78569 type:complete len:233 (+) Transcript_32026:2281-2979(+)
MRHHLFNAADNLGSRPRKIHGKLHKHWPWNALLAHTESALDARHDLCDGCWGEAQLDQRLHESDVIDVLQRTPALQDGPGSPPEDDDCALSHLGVLDSRDCVGDTWASRDHSDSWHASQPVHSVCGKDGVDLVPDIDNIDSELLRSAVDWGDVAARENKDVLHAMLLEALSHERTSRAEVEDGLVGLAEAPPDLQPELGQGSQRDRHREPPEQNLACVGVTPHPGSPKKKIL